MEIENNSKKDTAKGKIILFIVGVLIGAVISTAAFLVYIKTLGTTNNTGTETSSQQMQGGTPPEMSNGEAGQAGQGETPPEKPSESNSTDN